MRSTASWLSALVLILHAASPAAKKQKATQDAIAAAPTAAPAAPAAPAKGKGAGTSSGSPFSSISSLLDPVKKLSFLNLLHKSRLPIPARASMCVER